MTNNDIFHEQLNHNFATEIYLSSQKKKAFTTKVISVMKQVSIKADRELPVLVSTGKIAP